MTDGGNATDDDSGSWAILEEDLRRVRGLRSAALGGTSYIVPVAKQEPFGDSMVSISDETETIVLRGRQVVEAYGNLLATCLARFAGLCRPTWWLGRNFWLGQLAVANLPLRRRLMMPEASDMQARLKSLVATLAQLLAPLKVKGFEAGLSLCCEAYSAGLYLSPAAVGELLSEIRRQPGVFLDLAATVTRYPKEDVAQLTAIVEEALSWASQSGHGLIEGDELVGSLGYR